MSGRAGRIAILDVGSNSVRLFLCEGIGEQGPRGERRTTVTGLKRDAGADGSIAPDALERLDACLAAYRGPLDAFAPARTIAVGTSAVRDAPNRSRVVDVIQARLGVPLSVLSGDQEARCAFAGARLGALGEGPIMVVDIGGGSTELVRGDGGGPMAAVSLQLGAVRQTEAHLHADPPTTGELASLREQASALVRGGLEDIGGAAPAVGVAGTITTLAAIELGAYDRDIVHGHVLTRAAAERIAAGLAGMTTERRRSVPGLDPARAGVIVAGAVIACAVLEEAGLAEMLVSERDLLDGVVLAAGDPGSGMFRS